MSRRQRRVEDLLQREVSSIIANDVSDPRATLVTVTRVDLSADLSHAQLFVSTLDEDFEATETALRKATGFIRRRLARRLRDMKRIPTLTFHSDHGAEHSQHISDLLDKLNDERSDS